MDMDAFYDKAIRQAFDRGLVVGFENVSYDEYITQKGDKMEKLKVEPIDLIGDSVMVNKWAQRLMYTLQTEPACVASLAGSDLGTYLAGLLKGVQLNLEDTCRNIDNAVRESHPASKG